MIVSDFQLNEKFTAYDVIEHAQRLYDIPIIVISGIIGDDKSAEVMRMGANDLIVKSNPDKLVAAIEKHLVSYLDKKKITDNFEKAYRLLSQLSLSVNWILKHDMSEISIKRILKDYCDIVGSDKAQLYEISNGMFHVVDSAISEKFSQLTAYNDCIISSGNIQDYPIFFDKLFDGKSGESFSVSILSNSEQIEFNKCDTRSISIVPIYLSTDEVYGFIQFIDCQKEHVWSAVELKALESVRVVIGTILYKYQQEKLRHIETQKIANDMKEINDKLSQMESKFSFENKKRTDVYSNCN
jgi:hypothetical protein